MTAGLSNYCFEHDAFHSWINGKFLCIRCTYPAHMTQDRSGNWLRVVRIGIASQ